MEAGNVRAGRLKDRLVLQRPVDSAASSGVVSTTWQAVGTVYCQIVSVGTRESSFAIDSLSTAEQVEVRIREATYPSMSPACRFMSTDGTKIYDVSQVILDDTRDHVWVCLCQRRAL